MRFFHRLGFSIQSPWAYDLVTNVLFAHSRYYAFETLKRKYPKHAKTGEQLFRLVNALKPSSATIISDASTTKQAEAYHAYIQSASNTLQLTISDSTPSQPCDMLFVIVPQRFDIGEWLSANTPANATFIIIEDIGKSGKTLWQQILQLPTVTTTFDIGNRRGIAFFDPKKTKTNYKV